MQNALSLEVKYYSLRRETPIWRWIAPHALGFDGFRWHLRAWCHEHDDFRDFVISRVLEVRDSKKSQVDFAEDSGWHREVTLKIGPNPRLSAGAKEAVEIDYGMVDGVVELKTRACLSVYVERFLGLDLDPTTAIPERQQIVLLNREEVESARAV
jgi:predicted DNA-binding transcriptional regulator YafY